MKNASENFNKGIRKSLDNFFHFGVAKIRRQQIDLNAQLKSSFRANNDTDMSNTGFHTFVAKIHEQVSFCEAIQRKWWWKFGFELCLVFDREMCLIWNSRGSCGKTFEKKKLLKKLLLENDDNPEL
jgi:hypothetical protein